MRRLAILACSLLFASATGAGERSKAFTLALPGEGITEVVIEAAVATIDVTGADVTEISGDVELTLDRDEWSSRRAEKLLAAAHSRRT